MEDLIWFFLVVTFWFLGTLQVFQILFKKYMWPKLEERFGDYAKVTLSRKKKCPECGGTTKHFKTCSSKGKKKE